MNTARKAVSLRAKVDKEGLATMKNKVTGRKKVGSWKQLTIRVPSEVHRALKIRAAEEERSCSVIVEGLIRRYLVGEEKSA